MAEPPVASSMLAHTCEDHRSDEHALSEAHEAKASAVQAEKKQKTDQAVAVSKCLLLQYAAWSINSTFCTSRLYEHSSQG